MPKGAHAGRALSPGGGARSESRSWSYQAQVVALLMIRAPSPPLTQVPSFSVTGCYVRLRWRPPHRKSPVFQVSVRCISWYSFVSESVAETSIPKAKRATVACTACRKRQVRVSSSAYRDVASSSDDLHPQCQKAPSGSDCLRCQKMNLACEYVPLNVQRAAWEEQQRETLLQELVSSSTRTQDPVSADAARSSSYPASELSVAGSSLSSYDRTGHPGRHYAGPTSTEPWSAHAPTGLAQPIGRPDPRHAQSTPIARSPYPPESEATWTGPLSSDPIRRYTTPALLGPAAATMPADPHLGYARSYNTNPASSTPTALPRLQTHNMAPPSDYAMSYAGSPASSVASGQWPQRSATPSGMTDAYHARTSSPWSGDARANTTWSQHQQPGRWQHGVTPTTASPVSSMTSHESEAQYHYPQQEHMWQFVALFIDFSFELIIRT
jgi:hypothetical protein